MTKIESSEYATLKSSRVKSAARVVCREIFFMVLLSVCLCYLVLSGLTQAVLADELESSNSRPLSIATDTVEPLAVLQFDIPRQRADGALTALGQQADITVVYRLDWVKPFYTNALQGSYALPDAVAILLAETGLTARLDSKGHLIISQKNGRERESMNFKKMNSKKKLLAATIGFFVGAGTQGVLAQEEVGESDNGWLLEEVVVTATKRETSLQDTAMSISALSGDTIEKRGLVGMGDYLRTLPGVSMQDRGAGQNSIVIRGLATNPQIEESTSSVYFGETPVSDLGSASQTGGVGSADIKLVDVERVEVLRGPQGTLYGAGSMGGTVRVIPVAPNLQKVEGKIATRFSQTSGAGGENNMVQAVINLPIIEEELAVRGVVYDFDNSGYIDNVAGSQPSERISDAVSINGARAEDKGGRGSDRYQGYRLTALWNPVDQVEVALTNLQQEIDQDGMPEVNLSMEDDFQQARLKIGSEGERDEYLENKLKLTNLVVGYDLGWAELESSSSWIEYDSGTGADLPFFGEDPFYYDNVGGRDLFAEELKLTSSVEGPLRYVLGLYYEEKEGRWQTLWKWSGDPGLDPYPDYPHRSNFNRRSKLEQKALFGELSYAFTDKLTFTFGGRHFDYSEEVVGTLFTRGELSYRDRLTNIDEDGQIYKTVVEYTPNDNMLLYAQWSEGFRLGFGQFQNERCTTAGLTVTDVKSDTTDNFEVGIKSLFMDDRVTINAAVYSIKWNDLPLTVTQGGGRCSFGQNVGEAQSQGVEVDIKTRLLESLYWDISASYQDATLESDSSLGNKGDSLPGSANYNLSTSVQYEFLVAGYDSFARIDYSYVDDYFNSISQESGTLAGGYGQANLKLGAKVDDFEIDLFVNNVGNKNALTWVETRTALFSGGQIRPAYRIRPRTIGVNINYHF